MGWLFGKKKDGLYRGDAPASMPGTDSAAPAPYLGGSGSRPHDPGGFVTSGQGPSASVGYVPGSTPYGTTGSSSYGPGSAPYGAGSAPYGAGSAPYGTGAATPAGPVHPAGQPGARPTKEQLLASVRAQASAAGMGPQVSGALARAQLLQARRTRSKSPIGRLFSLFVIGGLVLVGFAVVGNLADTGINPFSSNGAAPEQVVEGVLGSATDVTLGDNTYQVTISSAVSQPTAAFGSFAAPSSGGFLIIELGMTRTDSTAEVSQISWYDWTFTPESGEPQTGELLAGGYDPLLSTLNLAVDESVTGLIAFDTAANAGTLGLTNYDGTWAQWPITATSPGVASGEFGVPVHPEAGGTPFTVTVANPRWIVTGDPAARFDPETGSYLVLDVAVALDDGALEAFSSLSLGYNSWEFVPDGGEAVPAGFGVTGAESLNFSAGQPTSVGTLIAFDAVRGPGTLNLVNADGSVLATWVVPAL